MPYIFFGFPHKVQDIFTDFCVFNINSLPQAL